jgi:hypothetical protein
MPGAFWAGAIIATMLALAVACLVTAWQVAAGPGAHRYRWPLGRHSKRDLGVAMSILTLLSVAATVLAARELA